MRLPSLSALISLGALAVSSAGCAADVTEEPISDGDSAVKLGASQDIANGLVAPVMPVVQASSVAWIDVLLVPGTASRPSIKIKTGLGPTPAETLVEFPTPGLTSFRLSGENVVYLTGGGLYSATQADLKAGKLPTKPLASDVSTFAMFDSDHAIVILNDGSVKKVSRAKPKAKPTELVAGIIGGNLQPGDVTLGEKYAYYTSFRPMSVGSQQRILHRVPITVNGAWGKPEELVVSNVPSASPNAKGIAYPTVVGDSVYFAVRQTDRSFAIMQDKSSLAQGFGEVMGIAVDADRVYIAGVKGAQTGVFAYDRSTKKTTLVRNVDGISGMARAPGVPGGAGPALYVTKLGKSLGDGSVLRIPL